MLRRLRRPVAAALGTALLTTALAACGSDSSSGSDDADTKSSTSPSASTSESASAGLPEVSFDGEVGKSLTATWHSAMKTPASTTVTTLVKGSGDEIADGDTISAYLYLGDGTTQKDAFSSYDNGQPESIPNDDQAGAVFTQLFDGATYGSRVVAVTTPTDLFGPSGAQGSRRATESSVHR